MQIHSNLKKSAVASKTVDTAFGGFPCHTDCALWDCEHEHLANTEEWVTKSADIIPVRIGVGQTQQ
jgi:hypothetical protein